MRPKRRKSPAKGRKSALERPKSRCGCRHLKKRASALGVAGVVQTFPNEERHMNNTRRYLTTDFSKALHHPLRRVLTSTSAAANPNIPDEEVPLDALFTQIITKGLNSLHGKPQPAKVIESPRVSRRPVGLSQTDMTA